jgi:catechol 2,3-dioxygenase-like lactoylglutathione lyase family enzyme
MAGTLELLRISHVNAIVDGYADTLAHFCDRLGFQLNMEIPDGGDGTDACLATLGGVMFELFAPKERGERGQGRLLDRFGDHYIGVEFQVPDVPAAREWCNEHDVRIINDTGRFFFTYPGACLGISWELWNGNWLDPHPENASFTSVHPASYWEAQPLGITGLARLSVAVNELDDAIETLQRFTGAPVIDKFERPRAAAHAAHLQVGDTVMELLAPTGDGPVGRYLERYGERIRSTVFRVLDLGRTEAALADLGLSVVDSATGDAIAIAPEQNKNLRFEFTE